MDLHNILIRFLKSLNIYIRAQSDLFGAIRVRWVILPNFKDCMSICTWLTEDSENCNSYGGMLLNCSFLLLLLLLKTDELDLNSEKQKNIQN